MPFGISFNAAANRHGQKIGAAFPSRREWGQRPESLGSAAPSPRELGPPCTAALTPPLWTPPARIANSLASLQWIPTSIPGTNKRSNPTLLQFKNQSTTPPHETTALTDQLRTGLAVGAINRHNALPARGSSRARLRCDRELVVHPRPLPSAPLWSTAS